MDDRTLTALYDTRGAAEAARAELIRVGVPEGSVTLRAAETTEATTGGSQDRGFWGSLSDLFMPDEDRHTYAEGMRRGGCLLSAQVPAGLEDEAITVLERSEPVDLDQRSASWRESGWTGTTEGYAASAAPAAGATAVLADDRTEHRADTTASTAGTTGALGVTGAAATGVHRGSDDDTVQVVEEQLRVGKREVGRGSVRVRSYVREIPVEEQVELRQEHVSIERRPVDRELAPGEATAAFQERTIEAVERGEEAVVSKTARVVEEIAVRKDVERETEVVRDTVHKTEVEVEDDRAGRGLGAARTDGDVDPTTAPVDPTTR